MSWTDEEIDKLFKDGAGAKSFEYDNAYFSEMEAAALPVNKKGKDFLWMGTALLFIAVLTTGYFVNNTNDNTFNGANDQLANLEVNNENKGNTVDSKSSIDGQQSTKRSTELNDQSAVEGLNGENLTSEDAKDAAANSKSINDQNSKYTPLQQKGSSKSIYNSNSNKLIAGNGNSDDRSTLSEVVNTKSTGSSDAKLIVEKDPIDKPFVALRGDIKINNQKDLDVVRAPITAGLNVNSANPLDQGINQGLVPNALPPLPLLSQLRPKATFYVEMNGGVSQSLIDSSNYINSSFGGGIGIDSYFGNFNLTTGLNFKMSDHKDLSLTRAGKFYDFGSQFATNTYEYGKVYSIELPISLGYTFGKHNLNIGVRPSVLVVAKIKHLALQDGEVTRSEESYGLAGGLKRYGVKPTFGYSYHMNKWTIGANIGVQLMQSVNEDYIDGVNNSFPVDGQIYFRRTIRLRK